MAYKDLATQRVKHAAYRVTHREEIKVRSAAYRVAHREEIKLRDATYRAAHREDNKARCAAYGAMHREEKKLSDAEYHAARWQRSGRGVHIARIQDWRDFFDGLASDAERRIAAYVLMSLAAVDETARHVVVDRSFDYNYIGQHFDIREAS